jgi:hypothetical protein
MLTHYIMPDLMHADAQPLWVSNFKCSTSGASQKQQWLTVNSAAGEGLHNVVASGSWLCESKQPAGRENKKVSRRA